MNWERPPAPVQTAVASGRDVAVYIDAIGRAVAKETVWVKAQVEGRIEETRFEDGADLKKGDVLFVLDARPFEARLAAAEASLLRARAALARAKTAELRPAASLERAKAARDLARAEFARVEGLVETKAVSKADFDNKKSTLDMMEAEVGQAEGELATTSGADRYNRPPRMRSASLGLLDRLIGGTARARYGRVSQLPLAGSIRTGACPGITSVNRRHKPIIKCIVRSVAPCV